MIDKNRTGISLLFIIFIFFGIAHTIIDPLIPIFSQKFNIGYDKIGIFLFLSSFISLFSTFAAGRLSDKFNIKYIILTGLLLLSVGFFIFSIYISIAFFIIILILFRAGAGIIDSSVHAYISRIINQDHNINFVKLDFFWYVGAILSPLIVSIFLFLNLDIKFAFLILFFLIIGTIIFYLKLCRNKTDINIRNNNSKNTELLDTNFNNEKNNYDYKINPQLKNNSYKSNIPIYRNILRNKIIILCCMSLFLYIGIFTILSTWFTAYLANFAVPLSFSSAFLSLFWAFNAIGVIIAIYIIKKISIVRLLILYAFIACISTILYSFVGIINLKLVFLILQALTYSSFFPLLNAVAVSENKEFSGTILSVTISVSIIGLIFFQPLSGYLFQYFKISGLNIFLTAISICNLVVIFLLYLRLVQKLKKL